MGFILLAVLFLLILSGLFLAKSTLSKITIITYNSINFILLLVSIFNPFHLISVSTYAYSLVTTSILMFTIGYLLYDRVLIKYTKNHSQSIPKEKLLAKGNKSLPIFYNKSFYIIQVVILLILIYYKIRYDQYILRDGINAARSIMFQVGSYYRSTLELYFFSYFIIACVNISAMIIAYNLATQKIISISFILSAVTVILDTQIGYGRFIIFQTLVYSIVAFVTYNFVFKNYKEKKINFKKFISVIATLFICFAGGLSLTIIRLGGNISNNIKTLFDHSVEYFIGPFRMLDYGLKTFFNKQQFTFGRLSLGGLDQIIITILRQFHLKIVPINSEIGLIVQKPVDIGPIGYGFNAFYTSIMNFYIDFGIVGVIVIPLIFGLFMSYITNYCNKNRGIFSITIFTFSFYYMLISIIKWPFQDVTTWVILLGLFIVRAFYHSKYKRILSSLFSNIKGTRF